MKENNILKKIDNIRKKIGKTVRDFELISSGDCVVVGLSGGKDSYVLIDALWARQKNLPFVYKIQAVHVNVKNVPYKADLNFMRDFCRKRNIELIIIDTEIDLTTGKSPCFICSSARRTELFIFTSKNNCNKLALGHHRADTVETLLLNMAFKAEISGLTHKVDMFDRFSIIRPLLETCKDDIHLYANALEIPPEPQKCPFADFSRRNTIRKFLEEMNNLHPNAIKNMYRAMNNVNSKFIPLTKKTDH